MYFSCHLESVPTFGHLSVTCHFTFRLTDPFTWLVLEVTLVFACITAFLSLYKYIAMHTSLCWSICTFRFKFIFLHMHLLNILYILTTKKVSYVKKGGISFVYNFIQHCMHLLMGNKNINKHLCSFLNLLKLFSPSSCCRCTFTKGFSLVTSSHVGNWPFSSGDFPEDIGMQRTLTKSLRLYGIVLSAEWRLCEYHLSSIILRPNSMIWRLMVFQPSGTRSWDLAAIWWTL